MTGTCRTATGGRIRRDRRLAFRFDGRDYMGCEGDTLASALLANGVMLVGRSFKYHRPRGIVAAGAEEPNALVTVDRGAGRITPNLRATQVTLYDGLHARSQNAWPSLRFDLGAAAGACAPLLGAGFYYKTFMWPPTLWQRLYEPMIRAAAGSGRAPRAADPDRYLHHHAHCDVLVIGGGPTGMAAALAASAGGARVILCDEQAEPGGSLLAEPEAAIGAAPAPGGGPLMPGGGAPGPGGGAGLAAASDWLRQALAILSARANVTLLPRTTAFGWYPGALIGLAERVTDHLAAPDPHLPRERLWQVRAGSVVLAAGAIEQPLVFPENDRPGVMLADAARTYLLRYGVAVGRRVMVATSNDSAYRAALALHQAGVAIAGIADCRPASGSAARQAALRAGLPVFDEATITGTSGRLRLRAAHVSGRGAAIRCDTLLMSGGWMPAVHLFSQARGRLRFDAAIGAFVPGETIEGIWCAGACAGTFGLASCMDAGYAAGEAAARRRTGGQRFVGAGVPPAGDRGAPPPGGPDVPPPGDAGVSPPAPRHAKAFVDLQNDVTTRDLHIATGEGFRAIEHVKRYTTAGMATDQGKTSGLATLSTVAALLRTPITAVGHTTFRPPYTPVTFGALAGAARGALLDPVRQAPLHDWAAAHGAVFEDAGAWKRARCFPRPGETGRAAIARECRAVRTEAGVLDASTLGKIEVVGPDAAAFLDLMYPIDVAGMAPGRCRYSLLLHETGFVMDDGIVARLAADRFHITTTTGGAAAVLQHMEDYRQTAFPHLRVWLTSTTEHWAVIALQGPQAAAMLAPLVPDIALDAMRHMTVCACPIAGIDGRLFRVSFTGETGFELNVPARHAQPIWEALIAAGATPYGTDAMHVLRAEQGYIIVGQETDGTVTPDDLGMARLLSRGKPDFVGKRSLRLPDLARPDRRQLVGLLTRDPRFVLEEGAQLVADPRGGVPAKMLGHVTSACWSETLQRSVALALLESGRAQHGNTLYVPMPGRVVPVRVAPPVFRDPADATPRGGATPHAGATPRGGATPHDGATPHG